MRRSRSTLELPEYVVNEPALRDLVHSYRHGASDHTRLVSLEGIGCFEGQLVPETGIWILEHVRERAEALAHQGRLFTRRPRPAWLDLARACDADLIGLYVRTGDLAAAHGALERAREWMVDPRRPKRYVGTATLNLELLAGQLAAEGGDWPAARRSYTHVASQLDTAGERNLAAWARARLAVLDLSDGHPESAIDPIRAFQRHLRENGLGDVASTWAPALVLAYVAARDLDGAVRAAEDGSD